MSVLNRSSFSSSAFAQFSQVNGLHIRLSLRRLANPCFLRRCSSFKDTPIRQVEQSSTNEKEPGCDPTSPIAQEETENKSRIKILFARDVLAEGRSNRTENSENQYGSFQTDISKPPAVSSFPKVVTKPLVSTKRWLTKSKSGIGNVATSNNKWKVIKGENPPVKILEKDDSYQRVTQIIEEFVLQTSSKSTRDECAIPKGYDINGTNESTLCEASVHGIERSTNDYTKNVSEKPSSETSDDTSIAESKSDNEISLQPEFNSAEMRINDLGIQMISANLYDQIFQYSKSEKSNENIEKDGRSLALSIEHLKEQQLWSKKNSRNADVLLKLPELNGTNINEHFKSIAEKQGKPYKDLLHKLTHNELPPQPKIFVFSEGWTKYYPDGTSSRVDVPDCDAFVFDVEVCVTNGDRPTLASAVSDKHWYSWCSRHLVNRTEDDTEALNIVATANPTASSHGSEDENILREETALGVRKKGNEMVLDDLIPFGGVDPKGNNRTDGPARIIVGHNVSYDRVRIREQYYIPDYPLRFLDTMSLHIAVSGLVQEQRAMVMKNSAAKKKIYLPWMHVGCMNNLNEVHKFYCNSEGLKKQTRDVFVTGSLEDIRGDFQNLMAYCAKDVEATQQVLVNLLPLFYERCPHPVTFSGVLEMGSCFLPINHNWNKYIERSEHQYHKTQGALTEKLSQRAVEALGLLTDKQYRKDPWLWNLDWQVSTKLKMQGKTTPNWYKKLCKTTGEKEGSPEPSNMSTSLRVVPKLLRLTWKGYPLHHELEYGWGFLKPKYSTMKAYKESLADEEERIDANNEFPTEEFYQICPKSVQSNMGNDGNALPETQSEWEELLYGGSKVNNKRTPSVKQNIKSVDNTEEVPIDVGIPGVQFFRLPHKNGPNNNVGNPLAKDFLGKVENGTLSSQIHEVAELVLRTTKSIAYWRNARDRILSQNTVWLDEDHLPAATLLSEEYQRSGQYGAIVPQVVVCGTVTRRAVERTWLTASNARLDRIGSELKAMVTAPPGYHFVGADVDSQELWIAALLGDSSLSRIHGGTAMSWMTLQGSKAEGTDLHSKTASTASITRDQAKVINYGRIYGAGLRFLRTLLTQYNPSMGPAESRQRAEAIMMTTKGEKGWRLSEEGCRLVADVLGRPKEVDQPEKAFKRKKVYALLRELSRRFPEHSSTFADFTDSPPVWTGGSESHTFNCLEYIVKQDHPISPVLGAAIPRPLEPHYVGSQHMTSRMNWVVQSSAVDYLHLMAVSMRWLAQRYDIDMRFSISIHDEVRYLVSSKDRHRAALALQITNLLTRALFADRVGMPDLPLAVAFFSSVDLDKVLRKDPQSACVTPSNPHGLKDAYGVEEGTPLTIYELLELVQTLEKQDGDVVGA